jgi:hypothetical protein
MYVGSVCGVFPVGRAACLHFAGNFSQHRCSRSAVEALQGYHFYKLLAALLQCVLAGVVAS